MIIVSSSDRGNQKLCFTVVCCCFFQAEDGIRDLVRSRGLGDVYKRQALGAVTFIHENVEAAMHLWRRAFEVRGIEFVQELSLIHI